MPMSKRKNESFVIAVVILLLIGIYIGGYFVLGETEDSIRLGGKPTRFAPGVTRFFKYDVLVTVFEPVGWLEANARWSPVVIKGPASGSLCDPTDTLLDPKK